ncbi:MAG: class I SAM-dependent methyltransferase [Solirubrobacterales bacterium]|nr:class I SAM-dependent methyltransferase [Solirubrobacterales bacterium]
MVLDPLVIWHDAECGSYAADLALWRSLASETPGPVLDVGAGSGRVALDLARAGVAVTALDLDPALLAALSARAAAQGLDVPVICADAAGFDLHRDFALILVPMQTIQLLPDAGARRRFLESARRHLRPGGRLAMALAPGVEPFEPGLVTLPDPDVAEHDGRSYVSQPVAVRRAGGFLELERRRETVGADGIHKSERDIIRLAEFDPAELEHEGTAAGFTPEPQRMIAETTRHVGSRVVVLRA